MEDQISTYIYSNHFDCCLSIFLGEVFSVLEYNLKYSFSIVRNLSMIIVLFGEFFHVDAKRNDTTITYKVEKDSCMALLNGSSEYSKEDAKTFQLNCERAKMYRDYYTYLYGLPMKLKDNGTIIHDKVERKKFVTFHKKQMPKNTHSLDVWLEKYVAQDLTAPQYKKIDNLLAFV